MDESSCPKLLDLIPKDEDWLVKTEKSTNLFHSEEDQKLELTLGPPPDGDFTRWNNKNSSKIMSFGCFSFSNTTKTTLTTAKDHVFPDAWSLKGDQQDTPPFLLLLQPSQQHCLISSNKRTVEKVSATPPANTAVPTCCNTAHKRTAPALVVGWPPVRSCRRNLATSSNSKQNHASQNAVSNQTCKEKPVENGQKDFLFVKINMDGVPIGRKVDLKAHGSYEKLSSAVDELFRGLLAAQDNDFLPPGGMKIISGLLDGSGEYTLAYEDNEGDKMLVGDVPWHMFVCTVRRLRVLKTSEISSLCRGSKQREALCCV